MNSLQQKEGDRGVSQKQSSARKVPRDSIKREAEQALSSFKNMNFQFEGYEKIIYDETGNQNDSNNKNSDSKWAAFSKMLFQAKLDFSEQNIQKIERDLLQRELQKSKQKDKQKEVSLHQTRNDNISAGVSPSRQLGPLQRFNTGVMSGRFSRPQTQQLAMSHQMSLKQYNLRLNTPLESLNMKMLVNQSKNKPPQQVDISIIKESENSTQRQQTDNDASNNSKVRKLHKQHDDKKKITMDDIQIQPFKLNFLKGKLGNQGINIKDTDDDSNYMKSINDGQSRNIISRQAVFMIPTAISEEDTAFNKMNTSFSHGDNMNPMHTGLSNDPNSIKSGDIQASNPDKIIEFVRRRSCQCQGCRRPLKLGDTIVLDEEKELMIKFQKQIQQSQVIARKRTSFNNGRLTIQSQQVISNSQQLRMSYSNQRRRRESTQSQIRNEPSNRSINKCTDQLSPQSRETGGDIQKFAKLLQNPTNIEIINENSKKTVTIEDMLHQFKANNIEKQKQLKLKKHRHDSGYQFVNAMDRMGYENQSQKRKDKIKSTLDRRLGIDIPNKINQFKVYLTSTKEYQEALKHHKQQIVDEQIYHQQQSPFRKAYQKAATLQEIEYDVVDSSEKQAAQIQAPKSLASLATSKQYVVSDQSDALPQRTVVQNLKQLDNNLSKFHRKIQFYQKVAKQDQKNRDLLMNSVSPDKNTDSNSQIQERNTIQMLGEVEQPKFEDMLNNYMTVNEEPKKSKFNHRKEFNDKKKKAKSKKPQQQLYSVRGSHLQMYMTVSNDVKTTVLNPMKRQNSLQQLTFKKSQKALNLPSEYIQKIITPSNKTIGHSVSQLTLPTISNRLQTLKSHGQKNQP